MSIITEKCVKTFMRRMGGFPILFASSCVSGPQIRHISLFLRKQSSTKTSSLITRILSDRPTHEFFCSQIMEPVIISTISTKKLSYLQRKYSQSCYHTTCRNQNYDAGTTCYEHLGDRTHRQRNIESLIETWFYEVCPRGSLEANLPFRTEIRPLHAEEYPDMNKVIIQLHYEAVGDTEIPNSHQLSHISDLYDLKVGFDEDKADMKISCDVIKGVIVPVACTLLVPMKFDLKIKMFSNTTVSIQKMESNLISIENEKGDCYLNNIKCGSITALCRAGNITSKASLLGNVYFHTGKSGNIVADKLQGSNIVCETELGSMFVQSLYADSAIFKSQAGNIHLGQCHGQLCIQSENSHLKIESLDGNLDAGIQFGSAEVHLSRHNKADIDITSGDISISFPEGTSSDLNLDSQEVTLGKNVDARFADTETPHLKEGHIGEKGKALVNARTLSGTIHLEYLDWIQTRKLSFKTDDESA